MEFKRQKYMDALVERMHNGMIKVVTGIRRSGKSYLLFNLFARYLMQQGTAMDHILTMQLDRWDMRRYRDPDMLLSWIHERMTDEGDYYILLDEVQFLDHFEEVLNSLLYESHVDVYVTGSNSKFLSNDILTAFRGRGDEIHVYPLAFSEFMEQYDGDMYHGWADYATYGGLPQVASMKTEQQKITYLQSLFKETYLKDILERHKLKYPEGMEDLVNVLASSIGTLMNPTKILATFQSRFHSKLSLNTIRQYIDFLEEAFIDAVDFHEHLAAAVFLAQTELVVDCRHVERLLEHAQVGQGGEIAYSEVGGHHGLVVDADEHHEIFHAAHAPACLVGLLFMLEYIGE